MFPCLVFILRWFGKDKENSPYSGRRLSNRILRIITKEALKSVRDKIVNEGRDTTDHSKERKHRQCQIPCRESLFHHKGFFVFHVLWTHYNAN